MTKNIEMNASRNALIWNSNNLLVEWIKKNEYAGWDPYDALNSEAYRKLCLGNPFLEFIYTQVNVYSFINLRPILKIEKGKDTKGHALFIQAYANLYNATKDATYIKELEKCISFLEKNSLKEKFNFHCWSSHYFPYLFNNKIKITPDIPDIIGTSQAIIALVKSYKILKYDSLKEIITSSTKCLTEYFLDKNNGDYFFKYYLSENYDKVVLNASAQGLESISHILSINEEEKLKNIGENIVKFIIKNQKNDGSWVYSITHNEKERIQLDFHQGYMIDGLLSFLSYSTNKEAIIHAIEKGTEFYKNTLFFKNGQSYYRYPIKYPVDIHNQAQGIITFCKLSSTYPTYLEFANVIAKWTIEYMQNPAGFFYHQKWWLLTNQIPYMRWGQAWMLLALSSLLEEIATEK
jgi:hypothetical protein